MRFRVDTRYGWISFDEKDEAKAREYYASGDALRLRLCADLHDEGTVIEGLPLMELEWGA